MEICVSGNFFVIGWTHLRFLHTIGPTIDVLQVVDFKVSTWPWCCQISIIEVLQIPVLKPGPSQTGFETSL